LGRLVSWSNSPEKGKSGVINNFPYDLFVKSIVSVLELIDNIQDDYKDEPAVQLASVVINTPEYHSIRADFPAEFQELLDVFILFLVNDIYSSGSASGLPARLYIDIVSKAYFQHTKSWVSEFIEYRTGSFTVGKSGVVNIPIVACSPNIKTSGSKSRGRPKKLNLPMFPSTIKEAI
jgi:hypothetical protein